MRMSSPPPVSSSYAAPAIEPVARTRAAHSTGHLFAGVGAIALIASLFAPWFELSLPQGFRDQLQTQSQALPDAFRGLAQALFSQFPDHVEATAWELYSGADIAICAGGVVVLALILLSFGAGSPALRADARALARPIQYLGTGLTVFVLIKLWGQPEPRELFQVQWGAFVALAGALAIAIGGWAART